MLCHERWYAMYLSLVAAAAGCAAGWGVPTGLMGLLLLLDVSGREGGRTGCWLWILAL